MAWIELHQSVWTNKKTLLLAAELGVDETYAAAHMARLWCWALDNAPEGDLSGLPDVVIARGAGWTGEPSLFVQAAVKAGYLDQVGERLLIHDWYDYAGKLIEKRKADAERKRQERSKTTEACPQDVRRTSNGHPRDGARNRTVPNHEPNHGFIKNTCAPGEQRKRAKTPEQDERFAQFWRAYPKKRSKGQAERAWAKINPSEQLFKAIMAGLERAKTSVDWLKDGGKYIPYPATWLNAKGWEDEYDEVAKDGANGDASGGQSTGDKYELPPDFYWNDEAGHERYD